MRLSLLSIPENSSGSEAPTVAGRGTPCSMSPLATVIAVTNAATGKLRHMCQIDDLINVAGGIWTHVHCSTGRMNPRERWILHGCDLSVGGKDRERPKRPHIKLRSDLLDDASHRAYPSTVIPIDRAVP